MTHAERVRELLASLANQTDPTTTLALAQVHATMALVEAVEGWRPLPPPAPEPPPFEFTKEGQRWE